MLPPNNGKTKTLNETCLTVSMQLEGIRCGRTSFLGTYSCVIL